MCYLLCLEMIALESVLRFIFDGQGAICFTICLYQQFDPTITTLGPTTDIIALLSGQQRVSSAPSLVALARRVRNE